MHERELLDGVVVRLVLRDCARWKIKNSPKGVADPVGDGRVARRPVPDREDVLLKGFKSLTWQLSMSE